tara:strand:+ start:36950 stop:37396 length:447 start_codon:yes stop_codon:yes gene_type:complete
MGIFSRRKSNDEDRLDKISETLKELTKEDSGLSALFFYKTKNGGSSFLQGEASDVHKMLAATAQQDSSFASIIKMVAREIGGDGLDPRMPQGLKDVLLGNKKSGLVDLPGGHKGMAIDPKNIDSMSEEDIDDIINGILGNTKDTDDDK